MSDEWPTEQPLSERIPIQYGATDDELRDLAANAAPGPWGLSWVTEEYEIPPDDSVFVTHWQIAEQDLLNEDFPYCEPHLEGQSEHGWTAEPWLKDLRYITAAHPARVIALLDEIATLRARLAEATEAADRVRELHSKTVTYEYKHESQTSPL